MSRNKFTHVSRRWSLIKLDETEASLYILANDVCDIGCFHKGQRRCVFRVKDLKAWRGFTPDSNSEPLTEGYWRIGWAND